MKSTDEMTEAKVQTLSIGMPWKTTLMSGLVGSTSSQMAFQPARRLKVWLIGNAARAGVLRRTKPRARNSPRNLRNRSHLDLLPLFPTQEGGEEELPLSPALSPLVPRGE